MQGELMNESRAVLVNRIIVLSKVLKLSYTEFIEKFFNEINVDLNNVIINPDNSIDVNQDVDLSHLELEEIPMKFNIIKGNFACSHNQLTSLKGCPKVVFGSFKCNNNYLTDLVLGPEIVTGFYNCDLNELISLNGAPSQVSSFYCSFNKLTNLVGSPSKVTTYYVCCNNRLTSITGSPASVSLFDCSNNLLNDFNKSLDEVDYLIAQNNPLANLNYLPEIRISLEI